MTGLPQTWNRHRLLFFSLAPVAPIPGAPGGRFLFKQAENGVQWRLVEAAVRDRSQHGFCPVGDAKPGGLQHGNVIGAIAHSDDLFRVQIQSMTSPQKV